MCVCMGLYKLYSWSALVISSISWIEAICNVPNSFLLKIFFYHLHRWCGIIWGMHAQKIEGKLAKACWLIHKSWSPIGCQRAWWNWKGEGINRDFWLTRVAKKLMESTDDLAQLELTTMKGGCMELHKRKNKRRGGKILNKLNENIWWKNEHHVP